MENTGIKENWHIEKSISVGHLITTIFLIVGGLSYLSDQDKRIEQNAITIQHAKQQRIEDIERSVNQRTEDNKRIEKRLDAIDEKLNELIQNKS